MSESSRKIGYKDILGGMSVAQVVEKTIPDELLNKILAKLGTKIPFNYRGIKITNKLIKVTLECLNSIPSKTLPQNCKNEMK